MIHRFTRIVSGMVVHADAMRRNLLATRGLIYSGTVLLELAKKGVAREEAYSWVQEAAMRAGAGTDDFKALLRADARIMRHLSPQDLDRAFDLTHHLRHVETLFRRAFGDPKAGAQGR